MQLKDEAQNKTILHFWIFATLLIFFSGQLSAQKIGVNERGDSIVVYTDGSWRYFDSAIDQDLKNGTVATSVSEKKRSEEVKAKKPKTKKAKNPNAKNPKKTKTTKPKNSKANKPKTKKGKAPKKKYPKKKKAKKSKQSKGKNRLKNIPMLKKKDLGDKLWLMRVEQARKH